MSDAAANLSPKGEAAYAYARKGYPVLLLGHRSKAPLMSKAEGGSGVLDATSDVERVRQMWREHPDANIGIALGSIVMLDIDPRSGGNETLAALLARHGELPDTPTVFSGGNDGGRHIYFVPPPGVVVATRLVGPGVQLRGLGGYGVAPPSVHPDSRRAYAWDPSNDLATPMAQLPAWVLEAANPAEAPGGPGPDAKESYLGAAFEAAGMLGKRLADGRRTVLCPWRHEHTGGKDHDTSTVLFAPRAGSTLGWFRCLHSHCDARSWLEAMQLLPQAAREAAEAAYPKRRRESGAAPKDDATPSEGLPLFKTKKGKPLATFANVCMVLRDAAEYRTRLAYNTMAHAPELDGAPLEEGQLGAIRERIELAYGFQPGPENLRAAVRTVAEERAYHPVQKYLRSLVWDETERIDFVGEEILGLERDALTQAILRKWFISAATRALHPGCKMHTVLVLTGKTGFRKSTFFEVLAGAWFIDTAMNIKNKDSYQQLHRAWFLEWGEIEHLIANRHSGEVKAFLSSSVDHYRPPYAAHVGEHARSGIIVGSTNDDEFLIDPTGSRRFWPLSIRGRIDVEKLRAWRDQLWAEAVVAFDKGESWWLTDEQDDVREVAAAAYERTEPWEQRIAWWLTQGSALALLRDAGIVTASEILSGALGIDVGKQTRSDVTRVGNTMRRLKWNKVHPVIGGNRVWGYAPPTAEP